MTITITITIQEKCKMNTGQVSISITIAPADGGGGGTNPLVIDASGVPASGKVGTPYSGSIVVTGGTAPYKFSVSDGALPDGVSLGQDGTLSGTPTADGSFAAKIAVGDSAA